MDKISTPLLWRITCGGAPVAIFFGFDQTVPVISDSIDQVANKFGPVSPLKKMIKPPVVFSTIWGSAKTKFSSGNSKGISTDFRNAGKQNLGIA